MINNKVLQEKLERYAARNRQEEDFALKEILQEIALAAFSRSDFFKKVSFQGGTALRILYGLDRFSEDLDFILKGPDKGFQFVSYAPSLVEEFALYGIQVQIQDQTKEGQTVQRLFLRQESPLPLSLSHAPRDGRPKKNRIKFEIDSNPPVGSTFETKYCDFPFPFGLTVQDLPSLFAGKSHALLCRAYTKGRDWYDFLWYVSRRAPMNYLFLSRACEQNGPWKGQKRNIDRVWFLREMEKKIRSIPWQEAKDDVARFLNERELKTLELWSTEFFLDRLGKLGEYLGKVPSLPPASPKYR